MPDERVRVRLSEKALSILTSATKNGTPASSVVEQALRATGTRKVFLVLEFEDGALSSAKVYKTLDALVKDA